MWYFESVLLDNSKGWGSVALFRKEAIISEHADGRKIVDSSKCAIYNGPGWDGQLEFNEKVASELLVILNS